MSKWYEIKAQAKAEDKPTSAEVYIYGNIGDRWNEDGVIASDFVREIAALDVDEIVLRINSYGGSVTDGQAIYNALKRHKATVAVHVDGVAISCAGYIAMAGDTVTMAKNAQLMIHAPWGYAIGNAAEMRTQADVLDRYAKAMASGYADKSGKPMDDALALLTDGKDHWYSAEEAVAEGFADVIGDASDAQASLASSFDLSRFKPAAPIAAAKPAAPAAPTLSQSTAAAVTQLEAHMPDPIQAANPAPFARTKSDNDQVLAMFKPFIARDGVQALQTEVLADPSVTMEQIQSRLLTEMGKGATPANPAGSFPQIETLADEGDKRKDAVANALLVRAGVQVPDSVRASMSGNPYRGKSLMDIAKASLDRIGVRHDGMDKMGIVGAAFTQSTSDFPVLLENTMHKVLQARYARAALTWNSFCKTGSVSDFRAHNRYRTGSFGSLDAVNELGEFVNKTIPDGEKSSITATTKGNIINISRQTIVNDNLGAFVDLASDLGWAAARTVEVDVYALLALNAGLGPTMGDGLTLFHANHNNITTGAAIAMAALDLDAVAMASQTDVSGNDYLDLSPSVLLLPLSLRATANGINGSEFDPDANSKLQKPNIVRNMFREIVGTRRITGTRRYLFADPMEAPVLEVAFLDGAQEPVLDRQDGFEVDGMRWKVRLDYGVAAIDYRGAITNAGA